MRDTLHTVSHHWKSTKLHALEARVLHTALDVSTGSFGTNKNK